jgi:hypothetical protein
MAHTDWILDVLMDLKTFASANGLGKLAEQLDDTTLIAAAEIASQREKACAKADGENSRFEPDTGGAGRHQHA